MVKDIRYHHHQTEVPFTNPRQTLLTMPNVRNISKKNRHMKTKKTGLKNKTVGLYDDDEMALGVIIVNQNCCSRSMICPQICIF